MYIRSSCSRCCLTNLAMVSNLAVESGFSRTSTLNQNYQSPATRMKGATHHARTTEQPLGVCVYLRVTSTESNNSRQMDYPPCPYPPCTPAGGVSLGAYCPQKSLAVPHAAIDPGHDSPTELDWHRPSSNILINSPCQLYTRHIDTEHSLRSETQSSRSGIVSPSRVASPGSPKRQEITLLSSGSTTAANENLTMVSLQTQWINIHPRGFLSSIPPSIYRTLPTR